MPKLRPFLMRGQQSSLCQRHSSRTSYHSNTGWVTHQRKLSNKSNGQFLTINQYFSQQSAWTSNQSTFLCTTCLNANGTMSLQVSVWIIRKLLNVVLHEIVEHYNKFEVYHAMTNDLIGGSYLTLKSKSMFTGDRPLVNIV